MPAVHRLLCFAVLAGLLLSRPGESAAADGNDAAWAVCRQGTSAVEGLRPRLPAHLLGAMAKVESGRSRPEHAAAFAWPWTVMAEGRGRYLPTKAAAVAEVKRLQRRGVSNIDVGCMQVNLHYHGHAFATIEQAFDPVHNIAYAAEFLLKLRRVEHSWWRAIGYYHSRTPKHMYRYRAKVREAWRETRRAAHRRNHGEQVARAE